MTIALVTHAIGIDSLGAGSAVTGSINTTGATLLVAYIARTGGFTALVDSKLNTWTAIGSAQTYLGGRFYICSNPTVGAAHTFTLTAGGGSLCVLAFSGTLANGSVDQQNGASNNTGEIDITPGAITPSANNCVVISGFAYLIGTSTFGEVASINDGAFTITDQDPGDGFDTYAQIALAYQVQTSASGRNPDWTTPVSAPSSVITASIMSFKSASAFMPPANPLLTRQAINRASRY